jgi:hypothetical protein
VKSRHVFSKVHFILKKTWFILKFCKYVLINEFYKRIEVLMEKSCLESMHYCYLTTKNILGIKRIQSKWTFKIVNSYHLWSTLPGIYPSWKPFPHMPPFAHQENPSKSYISKWAKCFQMHRSLFQMPNNPKVITIQHHVWEIWISQQTIPN